MGPRAVVTSSGCGLPGRLRPARDGPSSRSACARSPRRARRHAARGGARAPARRRPRLAGAAGGAAARMRRAGRGDEDGGRDRQRGSAAPASARRRMHEAADAARIGGALVARASRCRYEGLGAYKYLVHLELEDAPHDRYRHSVEELLEYDRRRGARLVETLERFLADRGSVAASARALYIHPNTVRQRLERIERVTGLRPRQGRPALARAGAQAGPSPRRPRGPGVVA